MSHPNIVGGAEIGLISQSRETTEENTDGAIVSSRLLPLAYWNPREVEEWEK